jgi:hypothetical protein
MSKVRDDERERARTTARALTPVIAFTYVDSLRARAGEPLWAEFVTYVAEWVENQGDDLGYGILPIEAASMAATWRAEMAARPEVGAEGE